MNMYVGRIRTLWQEQAPGELELMPESWLEDVAGQIEVQVQDAMDRTTTRLQGETNTVTRMQALMATRRQVEEVAMDQLVWPELLPRISHPVQEQLDEVLMDLPIPMGVREMNRAIAENLDEQLRQDKAEQLQMRRTFEETMQRVPEDVYSLSDEEAQRLLDVLAPMVGKLERLPMALL